MQMMFLTFVTLEAYRSQMINVRKFVMEQKMMSIFIGFQQKKECM